MKIKFFGVLGLSVLITASIIHGQCIAATVTKHQILSSPAPANNEAGDIISKLSIYRKLVISFRESAKNFGTIVLHLSRARDYKVLEDSYQVFDTAYHKIQPSVQVVFMELDDLHADATYDIVQGLFNGYRSDIAYSRQFMQLVITYERARNGQNIARRKEFSARLASALNSSSVTTTSQENGYLNNSETTSCYGSQCYSNGTGTYSGTQTTRAVYNNVGEQDRVIADKESMKAERFDLTASDLEPQIRTGVDTLEDNGAAMALAEHRATIAISELSKKAASTNVPSPAPVPSPIGQ